MEVSNLFVMFGSLTWHGALKALVPRGQCPAAGACLSTLNGQFHVLTTLYQCIVEAAQTYLDLSG